MIFAHGMDILVLLFFALIGGWHCIAIGALFGLSILF
jgi:hypothetical protein